MADACGRAADGWVAAVEALSAGGGTGVSPVGADAGAADGDEGRAAAAVACIWRTWPSCPFVADNSPSSLADARRANPSCRLQNETDED